jgi:hypothetical protein
MRKRNAVADSDSLSAQRDCEPHHDRLLLYLPLEELAVFCRDA